MPNESKDHEREIILRERAAYVNGLIRGTAREFLHIVDCEKAAKAVFPLPPREEPRVVTDPSDADYRWTIVGGFLRGRYAATEEWLRAIEAQRKGHWSAWAPLPARVAMWADLLANPTRQVVDE